MFDISRNFSNAEPLRLRIPASNNLKKDSDLILDQLRAIDNRRLIKGPLTMLDPALLNQVNNALCEVLNL